MNPRITPITPSQSAHATIQKTYCSTPATNVISPPTVLKGVVGAGRRAVGCLFNPARLIALIKLFAENVRVNGNIPDAVIEARSRERVYTN